MLEYKKEFIRFMVECNVLTFGEFTLKSGRKSPYFLNAGNYNNGYALNKLGEFYAECINDNNLEFDVLFGPAYKGIPLCVSTAVALNSKYQKNVSYCFDRKEIKDHGEGGMFVGKPPSDNDKIVIIDDVVTSGKALGETLPKLKSSAKVDIAAMIITVNRMERGLTSDLSAVEQIKAEHGIDVFSIVTIKDIALAIETDVIKGKEHLPSINDYLKQYGA